MIWGPRIRWQSDKHLPINLMCVVSFHLLQESQLKALKDTVHICFSSVLHSQTGSLHRFTATATNLLRYSALVNNSRVTFQQPHAKVIIVKIWWNRNWEFLTPSYSFKPKISIIDVFLDECIFPHHIFLSRCWINICKLL